VDGCAKSHGRWIHLTVTFWQDRAASTNVLNADSAAIGVSYSPFCAALFHFSKDSVDSATTAGGLADSQLMSQLSEERGVHDDSLCKRLDERGPKKTASNSMSKGTYLRRYI
jgi:hypothetical protein